MKFGMPSTTVELYDMLMKTPDLCGKLTLINEGMIEWDLYDKLSISIGLNNIDGYISIDKKRFGRRFSTVTHWHPALDEIYEDLCNIGSIGCVLVIRKNLWGEMVLYMGKETECPYASTRKWHWGKIYYLKAK